MLTPSTRATIRPRSLSTSVIPPTQARSLFGLGWMSPRNASYDSQHDPLYPRLNRHHTMKARAKLAKSVRRRQQFDWDADVKPVVGPKHVRFASHWNGRYGPKWSRYSGNQQNQKNDDADADAEGYELNEKEKEWKEQMEKVRKRIESDPYEAIFGKRFEPFWSPLLRQWTGHEIVELNRDADKPISKPVDSKTSRERSTPSVQPRRQPEISKADDAQQSFRPAQHYAYSSSASWDSKTNKTKRSEWDSVSGVTRHYEYDPVSNRMILVEAPHKSASQQENMNAPASVTWKPVVGKPVAKVTPPGSNDIDISVNHTRDEFPSPAHKNDQTPQSPADSKPAAYPKLQENELDALTADEVRASMGKLRHQCFDPNEVTEKWKAEQDLLRQQVKEWDESVTKLRNRVTAIVDQTSAAELGRYLPTTLNRRASTPKPSPKDNVLQPALQRMQSKAEPEPTDADDAAAHESTEAIAQPLVMPKGWSEQADILQSDRVKRTASRHPYPTMRWLDDMNARKAAYDKERAFADAALGKANAHKIARLEKLNNMLKADVDAQKLAMNEQQDRSAGKIRYLRGELETAYKQSSIHADAFRDRILTLEKELSVAQNTANDVNVKAIKERYSEKIRGLKTELEVAYKQSSVHADEFTQRIKALEAELSHLTNIAGGASAKVSPKQQPIAQQWTSKEAAKKQSGEASSETTVQGEGDFSPDVVKFAGSDKWYKQSSSPPQPTAEQIAKAQLKLHDEKLVREVRSIYENAYGKIDAEHKQPAAPRDPALEEALAKHDRCAKYGYKDDGIAEELAAQARGPIDNPSVQERVLFGYKKDHAGPDMQKSQIEIRTDRPKQPDPAQESEPKERYAFKPDGLEAELQSQSNSENVLGAKEKYVYKSDDLEAELQRQSKPEEAAVVEKKYASKPDNLEAELKEQGRRVNKERTGKEYAYKPDDLEAQLKSEAEPSSPNHARFRPDTLAADLKRQSEEKPEYASDKYEADAAKIKAASRSISELEKAMAASLGGHDDFLIRGMEASKSEPSKTASNGSVTAIKWQDPPLYKIIAYDAGNDRFSDATTTSWDPSLNEFPISISEALSQLYQPARWTKYFASLQREGFQVVHAREHVLVLKKVQRHAQAAKEAKASSKTAPTSKAQTDVNPVDGTSRPSKDVHTATGDYASPTGFVNFDPVKEGPYQRASSGVKEPVKANPNVNDQFGHRDQSEYLGTIEQRIQKSLDEIRRNGARISETVRQPDRDPRGKRAWGKRDGRDSSDGRSQGKKFVRGLAFGGTVVAAAYMAGVVAEKADLAGRDRNSQMLAQDLERERLEAERRMRWRLDEGVWKKGS